MICAHGCVQWALICEWPGVGQQDIRRSVGARAKIAAQFLGLAHKVDIRIPDEVLRTELARFA